MLLPFSFVVTTKWEVFGKARLFVSRERGGISIQYTGGEEIKSRG